MQHPIEFSDRALDAFLELPMHFQRELALYLPLLSRDPEKLGRPSTISDLPGFKISDFPFVHSGENYRLSILWEFRDDGMILIQHLECSRDSKPG